MCGAYSIQLNPRFTLSYAQTDHRQTGLDEYNTLFLARLIKGLWLAGSLRHLADAHLRRAAQRSFIDHLNAPLIGK